MIPFHPFAEIFPLIEGDAFDGLVESLRQDGYRPGKQVVLFEGKVLDGRNRYRAALAAGIAETDIPFRDFDPAAEGHPLDFVEAENINRRHLDTSQLAMVANRITTLRHGGQRGQAAKLPVERRHVTQAAAARRLGVSERSVRAARAVQDKGTPALTAAADRGHIPVSVAAKAAAFAPAVQDQIAAEAEAGRANVVRNVVKRNARDDKEKALAVKQRRCPTSVMA